MPQQTKIFRVFVSSTFTDMQMERSILQRDAFPRLEKFCEENEARFQAVDLRWGVNEESSLNQKTLQICFNEIARCQKISPKPNFLVLLGDKYGWQPIPEIIPEDEMDAILGMLAAKDKELMARWYRRDENAVPPEYMLQSKEKALKENLVWGTVETDILKTLRDAVNKLSFTPEQRIKYFASATHQEIIRGALNPPEDGESPEKHVFAFSRNIAGLPQNRSAKAFIDLIGEAPDEESRIKLNNLKGELKKKLGEEHFTEYNGGWKDRTLVIDKDCLKKFNDEVYEKLKQVISDQLSNVADKDEIINETKLHGEFKTKLTEHFYGRAEILKTLKTYLNNTAEKRVLAMIGDSGSGKSSVMAKAIQEAEHHKTTALVVYRFIGTSSRSSNIISLLQSVCGQIARECGTTLEELAGEGRERALYDLNGLSEILKKCLALSTAEKPIILFLDALDQLSDTDNTKALNWLPREVPLHTSMVVASLPELRSQLNNHYEVDLPLLPVEEASKILDRWLKSMHRKLTEGQLKEVLDKFSLTGLPIYLKLAFERAKKWNSYTEKYTLKEDLKGIINNFIDLLEEEHTKIFVQDAICFMLCGRYQGLTEIEILEVLIFDKHDRKAFIERTHKEYRKELEGMTRIPIVYWSRLFLDLEPYLTERDADGVPIITFFHRQFNEVLGARYGI